MKIIIESITEWEKDNSKIEEDRNHGLTESDILLSLAGETKDKKESEWTKGLPFVWEHNIELDVVHAMDIRNYVQSYLDDALAEYSDQYCSDDYLKPTEFDGKIMI